MSKPILLLIKSLVALSFLAGLFIWVDTQLEWRSLFSDWESLSLIEVAIAVSCIMLSHALRVLRVFYAYRQTFKVSLLSVSGVSFSHNTLSFLLPMRLGEAALPILSRQRLNIDLLYSSSVLLLVRLFDAHWLALLLLFFAGALLPSMYAYILFGLLIISIPLLVAGIAWLAKRHPKFISIRALVSKVFPLIILYAFTGLIWISKISALAFVAAALGELPINQAWIATIVADASALSPVTGFANAGTFEAAFMLPLLPFGYESEALLKTALNLHILIFLTNIAIGALGALILIFENRKH